MRNLGLAAFCLTLTWPAQSPPMAGPGDGVDAYVAAEMARQKIPGVAIAILRGGEPAIVKGYGVANVEHQVPVSPDTLFQSASVGKQITAAAVMTLVEEGRIALDDPLTKFFVDAPAAWRGITVQHLLTHTSGIPNYTDGMLDYRRRYTEDDLVTFAYGLPLEFRPGDRWNYSNTGYVLLGALMRKVTGRFYGDVVRDRVFAPLGMSSARVISEADIVPHRAAGYQLVDGALRNQDWVSPELNTTADGSYYLSARDMAAWAVGIREQRVLSAASWTRIFTPVTLNDGRQHPYGFGWSLDPLGGRRAQRHSGGWQGFATYILRLPDEDLSIVVLTNLAEASPGEIAAGIAKATHALGGGTYPGGAGDSPPKK